MGVLRNLYGQQPGRQLRVNRHLQPEGMLACMQQQQAVVVGCRGLEALGACQVQCSRFFHSQPQVGCLAA
jgi:hypothetical protein